MKIHVIVVACVIIAFAVVIALMLPPGETTAAGVNRVDDSKQVERLGTRRSEMLKEATNWCNGS